MPSNRDQDESLYIAHWNNVTKRYGDGFAVREADIRVVRGEFFTLLGPSGSGKTTLLQMLAGLLEPTSGRILVNGKDVTKEPAYKRGLGVVFQTLALFPHKNVYDNIAFPLKMRRVGKREIQRRVAAVLEVVHLPKVESRNIRDLSGGQRQRVALARALVFEPQVLLLDEPLGALDRRLREDMQVELLRLHRELEVTIVNVTHDQREALMLSDRIGILNDGNVLQVATPEALYSEPATPFVASFLGDPVLLQGTIEERDGRRMFIHGSLQFVVPAATPCGSGTLVLRYENIALVEDLALRTNFDNAVEAKVDLAAFEGTGTYYEATLHREKEIRMKVLVQGAQRTASVGDNVWLGWNADDAPVLDTHAAPSQQA